MYVLAKGRSIVALDAATGRELWTHPNEGPVGTRGMSYWQSADGTDQRLLYINAGFLTAIDAKTGNTIESFGDKGRVDLRVGLDRDLGNVRALQTSNPGRVFEDLIIMSLPAGGAGYASSPADIHAYNVRTGALRLDLPHGSAARRVRRRDVAGRRLEQATAACTTGANRRSTSKRASIYIPTGHRALRLLRREPRGRRICSATACSRSMCAPVSGCGISKSSITISGITTPTAPKLLTVQHEGKPWMSSRSRPSSVFFTSSTA